MVQPPWGYAGYTPYPPQWPFPGGVQNMYIGSQWNYPPGYYIPPVGARPGLPLPTTILPPAPMPGTVPPGFPSLPSLAMAATLVSAPPSGPPPYTPVGASPGIVVAPVANAPEFGTAFAGPLPSSTDRIVPLESYPPLERPCLLDEKPAASEITPPITAKKPDSPKIKPASSDTTPVTSEMTESTLPDTKPTISEVNPVVTEANTVPNGAHLPQTEMKGIQGEQKTDSAETKHTPATTTVEERFHLNSTPGQDFRSSNAGPERTQPAQEQPGPVPEAPNVVEPGASQKKPADAPPTPARINAISLANLVNTPTLVPSGPTLIKSSVPSTLAPAASALTPDATRSFMASDIPHDKKPPIGVRGSATIRPPDGKAPFEPALKRPHTQQNLLTPRESMAQMSTPAFASSETNTSSDPVAVTTCEHTPAGQPLTQRRYMEDLIEAVKTGTTRQSRIANAEEYLARYWEKQLQRYKEAINHIRIVDKFTHDVNYCIDCRKLFQQPSGYRKHRLTVHHPELRPLHCLVCEFTSADSTGLLEHVIAHPLIAIASMLVPQLSEEDAACVTLRMSELFKERHKNCVTGPATNAGSNTVNSSAAHLPNSASAANNASEARGQAIHTMNPHHSLYEHGACTALPLTPPNKTPPAVNVGHNGKEGHSQTALHHTHSAKPNYTLSNDPITPHFAPHLPPSEGSTLRATKTVFGKYPPGSLDLKREDSLDSAEATNLTGIDVCQAYLDEGENFGPIWEKQFRQFLDTVQSFSHLRDDENGCHWCMKLTNEDKYWQHIFSVHATDRPLHCIFCAEKFSVPSALIPHMETCDEHTGYLLEKYGSLLLLKRLKPAMSQYLRKRCDKLFYPPKLHKSTAWIQNFLSWNEEPLRKVTAAYRSGATKEEKLKNVENFVWNYWRDQLDAMDAEVRTMRLREGIGTKDTYCIDCEKAFDTPAHFRIHRFGVHYPDKRPLRCLICLSQFAHVQSLWAHLKAHRPEKTAAYFTERLGKDAALEVSEICCKRMNVPKRARFAQKIWDKK